MRTLNNPTDPPSPYDEDEPDNTVRFRITLTDADSMVEGEYIVTQEELDSRLGLSMICEEIVRDILALAKQRGFKE